MNYYPSLGAATCSGSITVPSLEHYIWDALSINLSSEQEIVKLCELFQVSDQFKTDIHTHISIIESKIQRQQQVIAAIIADAGIAVDDCSRSRKAAAVLFENIFEGIPIHNEALDIIYTETQIFFCLDYQENKLRSPEQWQQLSSLEQEKLSSFLENWSEFNFKKFSHFPTFSSFEGAYINVDWCDRIVELTGISRTEITQILSVSVNILPTQQADKYLLHDIWGHNWQLALTQFQGDYMLLANCEQPLRAAETAYTAYGPLTCRELFEVENQQVKLNSEKARLFFQGEAQQRFGFMFTHLLGELTADVAEFKFIWNNPSLSEYLPSSSSLKNLPTKVDLGFYDIDFLFLKVLKPLLETQISVFEESVLEVDLTNEWSREFLKLSLDFRISLKQAILEMGRVFLEEYQVNYLPTVSEELNTYSKMLINLLQLQNVVNDLCTDATLQNSTQIPFYGLLLIFICCYCSGNSFEEFWEIDNVVASYFLPCYWQLSKNLTVQS